MMTTSLRPWTAWAIAAAITLGGASRAVAQDASPRATQVISANPFGIMLEFFNAEYERSAGASFSVGLGGSVFTDSDDTYRNLDAFWRFYPDESPTPLEGWSFGLKAGVTTWEDNTYFGAGFDVNRSWLLGVNDNFYVGAGIGLKRLIGHGDELKIIPTIRLVNIGFAF